MTEQLRVSSDGRVAQLAHVAGRYGTDHRVWVGITWPDGLLTVHRYTEDEVADWTPLPLPAPEATPPCCTPDRPHPLPAPPAVSMDRRLVESLFDGGRPATTRDIAAWVAALDAIPTDDPEHEHAHGEADRVLLAAAPPEVREAYQRVTARCSWWASS